MTPEERDRQREQLRRERYEKFLESSRAWWTKYAARRKNPPRGGAFSQRP